MQFLLIFKFHCSVAQVACNLFQIIVQQVREFSASCTSRYTTLSTPRTDMGKKITPLVKKQRIKGKLGLHARTFLSPTIMNGNPAWTQCLLFT